MSNPYDITVYPSYPVRASHPERLFTNSRLFGLQAAPPQFAWVLEIGCATGGNIIPLAYRYPEAHFVGFDYSAKQIEIAKRQVSDLGLRNIELYVENIDAFSPRHRGRKFDYILCHGVFSWVKTSLQDQIFDLCVKNLAEEGVAFISYNVFPGWNQANSLRELMLWATRNIKDPQKKIAKARATVKYLADGFDAQLFPYEYARDFKKQAIELLKHDDSYLIHEYLEADNLPVYFYQFAERATNHQLQYVTESSLSVISTVNLPEPFASDLSKNTTIVDLGQNLDFIRNTRFRQSILCHADRALDGNLHAGKIELFHIQLEAELDKKNASIKTLPGISRLTLKVDDVTVDIELRNAIICIILLHERRQQPISYQALCKLMLEHSELANIDAARHLLNVEINLMSLVLAGVLSLHSGPGHYTTTISKFPEACGFIRYQARRQFDQVSTLKHTALPVSQFERFLLAALDGKNDVKALNAFICTALKQGEIQLPHPGQTQLSNQNKNPASKQTIHTVVYKTLQRFAREACLIA